MKVLITGAAGFIGFHLAKKLCERNPKDCIVGVDNLNHYYDVSLKKARLNELKPFKNFSFNFLNIADYQAVNRLFKNHSFDIVVHLAAQAGVRYSLVHPEVYIQSNQVGFFNIIEHAHQQNVKHFLFASSSSVYGANQKYPYSENDNVDHPISFYAATKKSNELTAHTYAALYDLPCTGLRFFTVYGPWGRPDMAPYKFTKHIIENLPIAVHNQGNMYRDFTYIDDIIESIIRVLENPAKPDPNWSEKNPSKATSFAPYGIYNIGRGQPIKLSQFIEIIEKTVGKKAIQHLTAMQPGEVIKTWADTTRLKNAIGYQPTTTLEEGIRKFVEWYCHYHEYMEVS